MNKFGNHKADYVQKRGNSMIWSLVVSLAATLIIELILSIIIGIKDREDIKVIVCANLCTNPIVVYIANCVVLLNCMTLFYITVGVLEIGACFVEYIVYKKCLRYDKCSPLVISVVNNALSFGTGIIIEMVR